MAIVRTAPLGDDWRATVDGIARARGWPTSADPERLGAAVAALSRTYNDASATAVRASNAQALAARLVFSFVRDAPKACAAVRELVAAGLVTADGGAAGGGGGGGAGGAGRPLCVLDVGAGLGAMTWGLAAAL